MVLNPEAPVGAKRTRPLGVDLALKVERPAFVSDVPWSDQEREANPEHECVNGKEGAIVKKNTRPSNKGRDDAEGCGQSGEDELGTVANTHNISVGPDIEPCKEAENESDEGVDRKLKNS